MAVRLSGFVNAPDQPEATGAIPNATVTAGIDASTTTIPFSSATYLPPIGTQFVILIGTEKILITSRSSLNGTGTRGYEGTTAASHSSGANVWVPVSALQLARDPRSMTLAGDIEYLDSNGAPASLVAPSDGIYAISWTTGVPSWQAITTATAQTANLVYAGPATGSAAVPTFRSLVAADIPALSYGNLSGTLTAGRIPYASGAQTVVDSANLTWDGTYLSTNSVKEVVVGAGINQAAQSYANVSAAAYTPMLAGAGAGNVDNGVHHYKFTWSDTDGNETGAGAQSPAVTVVDKTANGKVAVARPFLFNSRYGTLNIYRDANDGVFKLVVATDAYNTAAPGASETYLDNVANASLGVTIPTANTTTQVQWTVQGQSFFPLYSDFWAGNYGLIGEESQDLYITKVDGPLGVPTGDFFLGGSGDASGHAEQNYLKLGGTLANGNAGTLLIKGGNAHDAANLPGSIVLQGGLTVGGSADGGDISLLAGTQENGGTGQVGRVIVTSRYWGVTNTGILSAANLSLSGNLATTGAFNPTFAIPSSSTWTFPSGGGTLLTSVTAHNLLSDTHSDTTAGTVARGDLITGQGASAKWVRLAKGTANQVLSMDGTATDVVWAAAPSSGAPTDATYIVQTASAGLSAEQAIGALSSGILRGATTTGVITSLGDILPTANGGTGMAFFTAAGPTQARIYTFPDAAATIARTDAGQTFTGAQVITGPVGSSALTVTGNTQTASFPVLDLSQTWNNGAVTFTALKLNVTETAAASGSLLLDLQVGASSKFSIRKDGLITATDMLVSNIGTGSSPAGIIHAGEYNTAGWWLMHTGAAGGIAFGSGHGIAWASATTNQPASNTIAGDLFLYRGGAAATLQMGADVNGAAVSQQLQAANGITGTDKTGGNFTLASGKGTGAGAISSIIFQTPTVLGSGTTAQSLATRVTIDSAGLKATQLLATSDVAGVSAMTSLTNATDTTLTNAYVVKGGQAATTANTGWIKIYVGTVASWVPYWSNATP